jgi:hypothetical protein
MRRWLPHDPGRSCLFHTITHYVTNQTNSQNAGALPTRRPASTPPQILASSRGAEGLAPSSEPMTTPSTRSRREPGCCQGPQPLHLHPRPGSTTRPCHGRVAWAPSPCRRSPALARLDASPRQRAPGPARAAAGPSATAAATVTQGGPGKRGQSRGWPRAPTRPCCPTCHRSAPGPAVETSAIMRTDLTDLTRLSPQASIWRVPVAGRRLGWAVRRLVLGSARAGDRAAGSLAVAEMRVRRASWPACGRHRWAGWWRR